MKRPNNHKIDIHAFIHIYTRNLISEIYIELTTGSGILLTKCGLC